VEIIAADALIVHNPNMPRPRKAPARVLTPLEEQVLNRFIKAARATGSKALAAKLRTVRAQLRTPRLDRADNPRLHVIATVLAELARLQHDRDRAARIFER
jgi:hypothetical protein